jgi:hypothetical protein
VPILSKRTSRRSPRHCAPFTTVERYASAIKRIVLWLVPTSLGQL